MERHNIFLFLNSHGAFPFLDLFFWWPKTQMIQIFDVISDFAKETHPDKKRK